MTDGKLLCESIAANKTESSVRLAKPKPFDTTGKLAEIIITLQFDDPNEAKKYVPGQTYNLTITEDE